MDFQKLQGVFEIESFARPINKLLHLHGKVRSNLSEAELTEGNLIIRYL